MLRPSRIILILALGLLVYIVFFSVPPGQPGQTFNPEKLARLEQAVLQADHERHSVRLFFSITAKLREELGCTWFRAADAGFHRTRAMLSSRSARLHYDLVLPDLTRAYEIERDWRGSSFDAEAAAKAELNSWLARRHPEINTADYLSNLIAESDAIRYSASHDLMRGAAMERVRALELRDAGGSTPDWNGVRAALVESYKIIHQVLRSSRKLSAR